MSETYKDLCDQAAGEWQENGDPDSVVVIHAASVEEGELVHEYMDQTYPAIEIIVLASDPCGAVYYGRLVK
jgi:hypothetical protein